MKNITLQADDIATFLENNPQFFLEHEYLLTSLQLPHPRSDKVISLAERQTLHLRKHSQQLEKQIAQFLQNARDNEQISKSLLNWTCDLLAFNGEANEVCAFITHRFKKRYELQEVQLRFWGDNHPFPVCDCKTSTQQWVHSLNTPYTGPFSGHEAASWFEAKDHLASMAVIPLYALGEKKCVGALALGSDLKTRFTYHLGTDFLEAMGQMIMALLARFYEQQK